jgi:hypothetical protein
MILLRSLLIKILFVISLQAQFQTYVYFNEAYESNPFLLPEAEKSWVATIEGGIQFNLSPISISYSGSFTSFSNFSERTFYWHQAALFSSFKKTNLGLYINQRFNRNDYTIYNYNTMTGYINFSNNIGTFYLYTSGNLIYNTYPELAQIDNIEVNGSLKVNKSFDSGTTFILGGGLFYKKYTSSYSYTDTLQSGAGTGTGQGMNGGSQFALQSIEIPAPSVSQFQYWIRIAQSITKSTGLAMQFRSRLNIEGATRTLPGLPFNYNQESEIFDDPMGYELQSLGFELTQILPAQIIFKASAYKGKKNYTAQGIYEDQFIFDPLTLRSDRFNTAHASVRKNFIIHKSRFTIEIWYRFYHSDSNSYWYNFENHYSSISLSINI